MFRVTLSSNIVHAPIAPDNSEIEGLLRRNAICAMPTRISAKSLVPAGKCTCSATRSPTGSVKEIPKLDLGCVGKDGNGVLRRIWQGG